MPRAPFLGYELINFTALVDKVVGTDLGCRISQSGKRGLKILHAGVVKDERVDCPLGRTPIMVR